MPPHVGVLDPEQLPFEPEDPEEEPDEDVTRVSSASSSMVDPSDRDWEFRTENLSLAEVLDGKTLAARLTEAASDQWQLVDAVDAGDTRVLVLRRPRKRERDKRHVGFAPPARA